MNEIARQRISERVIESLNKELLSKNMAGPMLGIHPSYLSCVVNPEKLNKCPDAAWEVLQKWVNSGLSITKYAEKNGVLVKKKPNKTVVPEKKSSKESNAVLVGIVNDPKDQKLEPRLTKESMIAFLIEEKASLLKKLDPAITKKIDAINVLLNLYIS